MYASIWKPAPPFFPMPNTGTVLDVSAGSWQPGHRGQTVMNGGVCPFSCIAAMPNMFKSVLAAGMGGCVLRAFRGSFLHAHDAETTMSRERTEAMARAAMDIGIGKYRAPEDLISDGRMAITSSVDYDGTELFSLIKEYARKRLKEEKKIKLELINTVTNEPYEYYVPIVEFWDSLSALKCENVVEMLDESDVGTKDLNMLAMRVNSGKSQIVDQAPDLTAKHGIYLIVTSHVGERYQLDPRTPNVKTLKWMKGDNIKLKRVPENLSFHTGNCYVITHLSPMVDKGEAMFPYSPGDELKATDLVEIQVVNMRGKYGPSGIPLSIVCSQREGWLTYMSNFVYLRTNKYGINGQGGQHFALALTPEYKMQRTTVRQKFRESFKAQRAALILVEMHWCFTQRNDIDPIYKCEPTQLYDEIKNMGYDWDLLLETRFWFGPIDEGQDVPYLSTMDLLKMRVNQYHPYWYPKTRAEMGLPEIVQPTATES